MSARPSKFSAEQKVRIKKVSTLSELQELYEQKKLDNPNISVNSIINSALEIGLPILAGRRTNLDAEELSSQISESVLSKLAPLTNSLIFSMKKITVLQAVQESMLGSLLQELEFYFQTKGVPLDPALLEEFKLSLPGRFESDKQYLIERLFEAADAANEAEEGGDE